MTLLRITSYSVMIVLLLLSLYLLIALPLLREPGPDVPAAAAPATTSPQQARSGTLLPVTSPTNAATPTPAPAGSGSRLVEVFGRIISDEGEPLEDVLITEERYFASTHSDASGGYRLRLELPYHRQPILRFLRAGFHGVRAELTRAELLSGLTHKLDVTLAASTDTLELQGWVANDLGIALEGARIEISALESSAEGNFYLTVFSDERGNFTLQGVPAETRYRLSATLAPDYPIYRDTDFYLGTEPESIQIRLESPKFVDLSGMIMTPGGAPVGNFEMYIGNLTTGVHTRKIVSDSSGYFSLDHFPLGKVTLTTRGAEFFRINGLELDESGYSNLRLIIDRGDRYLSGWVIDDNGLPLAKAMVTLDATRTGDGVEYHSYRSQSTDSNGKFSFTDLATGEHHVSVYAIGFDKLDFTHSLERQGEPLYLNLTPAD